jgi:prepilin-type processing-associated H-X9-DG protein
MAGAVTSGKANNVRWLSNVSYNYAGSTITTVSNATVAGTAYFGTTQTVWDSGYNTNFATTWHFSRGDNNISATTGAGRYTINASSLDPSKSPLDGDGPLSSGILADPSMLSSADKIALMGPSRNGDGADSQVNASGTNAADTINLFIDPTGRKKIVKVGDFTVESFTDGPTASRNLTANQEGVYAVTANQQVHEINDIVPNAKAKKVRQPSGRDIQAGGYANILFADGSNRRVNDNNGYGGANKGDSYVGPYVLNINATQEADRTFTLDNGAYDEVRDDLYLGRMRLLLTAGGGSAE